MASTLPTYQVLVTRDAKGVASYACPAGTEGQAVEKLAGGVKSDVPAISMTFSDKGDRFALAKTEHIEVWDTSVPSSASVLRTLPVNSAIAMHFSPDSTYLLTWTRPLSSNVLAAKAGGEAEGATDDNVPSSGVDPRNNLVVWDIESGDAVLQFTQKGFSKDNWPYVQWTSDEAVCARMVSTEVQFFDCSKLADGVQQRLKCHGAQLGAFRLAPGQPSQACNVAVFIPEKKGAPASVRIYKYPEVDSPISQKTFYKADDVNIRWSQPFARGGGRQQQQQQRQNMPKNECALLVEARTDMDTSGKSYYGETALFFLSTERGGEYDCNVPLGREGPIHSASWSASGEHFSVTYGYMPEPQTSIFNNRSEKVADCGTAGRNTTVFNTMSDHPLVAVAGFGNLPGDVDVWDPRRLKKVGVFRAPTASELRWAPDGRHAATSVLSPRMRVGNGFTIWGYDGTEVHKEDIEELLEVQWQPVLPATFPDRPPSPRTYAQAKRQEVAPVNKPAAYVPPHLRNRQGATNIVGSSGPSHNPPKEGPKKYQPGRNNSSPKKPSESVRPVGASGHQAGGARRNKNQKKGDVGNEAKEEANPSDSMPPADSSEDVARKLRATQKKMRQVYGLKQKQAAGEKLNEDQLRKLATEKELAADIARYEAQQMSW